MEAKAERIAEFLQSAQELTRLAWSSREAFLEVVAMILKEENSNLWLGHGLLGMWHGAPASRPKLDWKLSDVGELLEVLQRTEMGSPRAAFLSEVLGLMATWRVVPPAEGSFTDWSSLAQQGYAFLAKNLDSPTQNATMSFDLMQVGAGLDRGAPGAALRLLELSLHPGASRELREWTVRYMVESTIRLDDAADFAALQKGLRGAWDAQSAAMAVQTLASAGLEQRVSPENRASVARNLLALLEDVEQRRPELSNALDAGYGRVLSWGGAEPISFLMADTPNRQAAGARWLSRQPAAPEDAHRVMLRACDLANSSPSPIVRTAAASLLLHGTVDDLGRRRSVLQALAKTDPEPGVREAAKCTLLLLDQE